MLTAHKPFGEILDAVCAQAAVQSILLDRDARLLAHSAPLPLPDPMWEQILEEGGIPYHFLLEHTAMLEELWQLTKTRQPVFSRVGADRNLWLLLAPMLLDKFFAGYVIVCGDSGCQSDLLEDMARLLGRLYLHMHHLPDRPTGQPDSFFLSAIAWELLASDTPAVSDLVLHGPSRLGSFINGMRIPLIRPPYVIAALGGGPEQAALNQAGLQLRRQFPNLYHLAFDHQLLVLFVDLQQPVEELCAQLSAFAAANGLLCGLSLPFEQLEGRRHYKAQAVSALELGRRQDTQQTVFPVDQLYPDPLFQAAADSLGAEALWRSDLQALHTYDRENGTAYLQTLGEYLRNGSSYTRAASKLFVDRSTMNYRLAKIRSMMDCDFENPEVAYKLLTAIRIREISGLLP